jgi:Mg-chelatase subunit ChlD
MWAFWRRVQYAVGGMMVIGFVILASYAIFFIEPPTCFDGTQNGTERGVDCGGNCVRICASDVSALQVQWARSFRVTDGQYNAVAYISNTNQTAATPEVGYTFALYDESGLITERRGTSIIPPNSVYPVFEPRIQTGSRIPTQTFITLDPPALWLPAQAGRGQLRELFGVDVQPRLEAVIENSALVEAKNVEVVATIFDSQGNAITSSRTFIDRFAPRAQENLVFTWPEPIARTIRSCEVPSDIVMVLDRSGSMAADGGNPPEPLESAKRSAQRFVEQLRPTDQVAFFSYATLPSSPIEQVLTNNKNQAITAISGTRMGEDGVQYTNMGEAFKVAFNELQSARHRDNARKVIVFLTDGDVTRPLNPAGERDIEYAGQFARDNAALAKDNGVLVYTIGFGDFFNQGDGAIARDVQLIKDLASEERMYYEAPTVTDLQRVYQEIANDLCEDGVAVIDIVPKTDATFAPLQ